jgi:hypothetical protein
MKIRAALMTVLGWSIVAGFLLGLLLVVAVPFELWALSDARDWPSRPGVITHASLQRHRGGHRSPGYWSAEIGGTYRDDGQRFWISRVRYGDIRVWRQKRTCLEAVERYPVGKEIDVFFDPELPTYTILEPGAPARDLEIGLALGAGLVLTPFALYALRGPIGRVGRWLA